MKNVISYCAGVATGIAFILLISLFRNDTTQVHRLNSPLLLTSNTATKNVHLLPAGTTLYYDKSFPEGFARYRVYINIDRTPLALVELDDPTEIDPIDARFPDESHLVNLLELKR